MFSQLNQTARDNNATCTLYVDDNVAQSSSEAEALSSNKWLKVRLHFDDNSEVVFRLMYDQLRDRLITGRVCSYRLSHGHASITVSPFNLVQSIFNPTLKVGKPYERAWKNPEHVIRMARFFVNSLQHKKEKEVA